MGGGEEEEFRTWLFMVPQQCFLSPANLPYRMLQSELGRANTLGTSSPSSRWEQHANRTFAGPDLTHLSSSLCSVWLSPETSQVCSRPFMAQGVKETGQERTSRADGWTGLPGEATWMSSVLWLLDRRATS